MHVEDLPAKTQDYLKVIWDLHERTGDKATLGDIAERMGEKKPTASEAVKKLAARGFVVHEPYQGIMLTEHGKDIALVMVRRHRLIESFLVSKLGYTWDQVHEEAEKLEHAVSDDFIARIDAMLGYPKRDPHGDPIPSESGDIEGVVRTDLTDIRIGESVVVDRINDSDPELLRYLAAAGVGPGTELRAESAPYAGMRVFAIVADSADAAPQTIHVADSALWAIKATPQKS
ncbi:MAG: metal-dependent transcriptional regulator [Corynebacterium sp.]|uniref:metal-dependent transcriptional regulator n=1 Tax=Corynebacterium sp. TaxID=1720 RepID=UPI0026DAA956|nr:metal-dependent transcriptional regulator [Corynebacterium sp.]MDO5030823.1 metal-dependent transcriptional regulator [Corynebacterium sp.]